MNVFARLRKMGKEADLFIFSGEPAIVVVGKPWSCVCHMCTVLHWFDRYLQPALKAVPVR